VDEDGNPCIFSTWALLLGGAPQPPPSSLRKSIKCVLTHSVKRFAETLQVQVPSVNLVEKALVGQFTRVWPLKAMTNWIQKRWIGLIKGNISHYFYFCGSGFYPFYFEIKRIAI
jgi:hypothetical protein